MSNSYVTDTMALVLRLEKRRLPPNVKSIFETAEAGHIEIFIPAIVLAEIGYLSEREKIERTWKRLNAIVKNIPQFKLSHLLKQLFKRVLQLMTFQNYTIELLQAQLF